MDQRIWVPDEATFEAEIGQRQRKATAILARWGQFSGKRRDLALLQRAVNEAALPLDDALSWQSLGIALGFILAHELGLRWVLVDDEYGRDPALQLDGTTTILFPMTMISKRIERGERPNLEQLFATIKDDLKKRPHQRSLPS